MTEVLVEINTVATVVACGMEKQQSWDHNFYRSGLEKTTP